MRNLIQTFISYILLVQAQSYLLRDIWQYSIQEVRYSALYPDCLEIIFPDSYERDNSCSKLVINDSYLCHIKHVNNTTITCDYPVYQLENERNLTNQICRTFCSETSGCSLLLQQTSERGPKFFRNLQIDDPFSFSPQSASFVYPSYITIDLKEINQTIINVFLQNAQNTYEALILKQDVQSLVCLIKGGNTGNYTIQLVTNTTEIVSTALFQLQILITSVSPQQGSVNGGVILTINGTNFSMRDQENQIMIGNVPCTILSSSPTQLQCVTQKPDSNNPPTTNTPYDVIVYYGNQQSTVVDTNGQFTFIQVANLPSIQSIESSIKGKLLQGETVIINGQNLQVDEEDTVLLIGGFNTTIDSLNSTQLNFTVGFDMPNIPQNLSIHVGTQGSTDDYQIVAPSMLLGSSYLNSSNNQLFTTYNDGVLMDFNLSNYDPTYTIQVGTDQGILNPSQFQITQDSGQQNLVYLRLYSIFAQSTIINSILIGNDEILTTPIAIRLAIRNPNYSYYSYNVVPVDEDYFAIQFIYIRLAVFMTMIRNSDYSQQIIGYIQKDYLVFPKLPQTQGFLNNAIWEMWTTEGTFIESIYLHNSPFAFLEANSTLNILDNPFPSGQVYPGQKFKVQFTSSYIPVSDFLCVECQSIFSPIFAENEENSDNIYEFTIPPVPLQTQFDGVLQCTLYHRSQWNSLGDSYVSRHTLFNDQFTNLQSFIQANTMIEDISTLSITYSNNTNTIINSISPSSISYIGGEVIEFKGINLIDIDPSLVKIEINGIDCSVEEATSSHILCVSGFLTKMQWVEESYVSVYINETKANMLAPRINIVMRQIDPLPFVGFLEFYDKNSKVYVPQFYSMIMDDTNQMNGQSVSYDRVLVDGTLVFLNTISYEITLNQLIGNGQVLIGSSGSPFGSSTFKMTINNQTNIFNVSAYSTDTLVFINLVTSALQGTNTLNVLASDIKAANLTVDDEITITGTSQGSIYEKVTIASISGNVITLKQNLTSDHIVGSEALKSKDGSTYNFNVSPTVFKNHKYVQLNFNNQIPYTQTLRNYYPPSISFLLEGVQFALNHSQVSYQYNFNSTNSLFRFHDSSRGSCIYFPQFENNVLVDQQLQSCFKFSIIQNSLFLSNTFNTFTVADGVKLANNTFMSSELSLPSSWSTQQTVISNNTIYATDVCIRFPYFAYQPIPLVMDDNICFSSNYAMDAIFTGFLLSQKYYLIAVNLLKGGIVQKQNYLCIDQSFNLLQSNVQGAAFFQSSLTNQINQYKPVAYSSQQASQQPGCIIKNYISNVEFKDFDYSQSDYLVENLNPNEYYYKLLSFANITSDFNGILLSNTPNLIIQDEDGTFSGVGKRSNLVAHSSYLHDNSCINKEQYSICQNNLIHTSPIYTVCSSQIGCSPSFTRSNNYTLSGPYYGQFFVNGETYQVNLVDGSNNPQSIYVSSINIDFKQNNTNAIVLKFPIFNDYSTYLVVQQPVSGQLNMLYLSTVTSYNQLTSKLDPSSCSHGDSFFDGVNISVCYQKINSPLTLYVSCFPEVYPIPATLPIDTRIRDFNNSIDWFENNLTWRQPKRWTILSHWRMQISQGGVYNIPTLVIQGSLEIVGSGDVTLNLRGIYIGAGSLTVSTSFTGKLTINLVSVNPGEIIFTNPFEKSSYYEGSIVVNNKLTIKNLLNSQPYYRITKMNSNSLQNVQNKVIVQNLKATSVSKGDSIFIVSPRTGYYILTTISDYPMQITFDNTLLTLKDNLNSTFFSSIDNLVINSTSTLSFTPYVKIFRQRIQINNFNIYTLSHQYSYIPEVLLQGINFMDSKITQQKFVSQITISDCTFQVSASQDYYFSNIYTYYTSPMTTYSPSFTLTNNLFLQSNNPVIINMFYHLSTSEYYYNSQFFLYYPLMNNINCAIILSNNLIVDNQFGIQSYYTAVLSQNVVIKSSYVGATSSFCLNNSNDAFYQCQRAGISYSNCNYTSNLLVAYSGKFSDGNIQQMENIFSISNQIFFVTYANGGSNSLITKQNIQINNAVVVVDQFESNQKCTPTQCIQLTSPQSFYLSAPTLTISNSKFYNIICSNVIFFESYSNMFYTHLNETYLPSVAFQNTTCNNCQISQSNFIQASSDIPVSFLVQDYKSVFLRTNLYDPLSYIFTAQQASPYIKSEHSSNLLGRLFIQSLSSTNPNQFSLQGNTYNVQQVKSVLYGGTIVVFPLNNLYQFNAASIGQIVLRMSSHNLLPSEYIQLSLSIGKEKGIKLFINQIELTPTPGLDCSNGYGIMKMIGNQSSRIQCGMNIYDPTTDSYHIILTNDPDCVLYIYQYIAPAIVVIIIPTPILPSSPPPEEVHLCLAQRHQIYVIDKLSAILGISKKRIKMKLQSNFSTCKNSRLLQQDTGDSSDSISFTFAIDPDDSDNQSNCTFNPNCSQSDIDAQNLVASQQNLSTFLSLQTLQEKALQTGFIMSSVQPSLPNLVSPCTQGQYYQDSICVDSCSSNNYPYSQSNQNLCVKCNIACNTCTGPNATDCQVLKNSNLLDCVDDYFTFQNSSGQSYCGKCPSNCAIDCKQLVSPLCPATQCLAGYVNQNGYCFKQCLTGYFNNNNNGVCMKCMVGCKDNCSNSTCTCMDGYYPQVKPSYQCLPCPLNCATCSSDTVCNTCIDEKYDLRTLCEIEKYIQPQSQQGESQLSLILGLTLGLSGGAIVVYASILFYLKIVKLKKYSQKIQTQEEIDSEPNLKSDAIQTEV